MKNLTRTSAVLLSLALTLASAPLPAFSAVSVQTTVSQGAAPGALTGLPGSAASANLGNGSLLRPAGALVLNGSLALPQSPIVVAAGVKAAVSLPAFAAPAAPAPVSPMAVADAPDAAVPALASGLAALSAQAAPDAATPAQRQSLAGRLASALAAKLNLGRIFDNGKAAEPNAFVGILPQKRVELPGVIIDKAPEAPNPKTTDGVSIESFDLPGVLNTGADVFSAGPSVLKADPSDESAVERALRALVDADPVKYGVSSADLKTVHVRRVAGVGHQADTIYAYFQQQRRGFAMHGTGLSFTIKVLQGQAVVMGSMAKLYPSAAVDTDQRFPDDELKTKALEKLGPYVQEFGLDARFLEKKIVYVKDAWHAANIYLVEVPVGGQTRAIMLGADVATGEIFVWNPSTLRQAKESAAGSVAGKSVEPGPIMPGAKIQEIPLGYLEVKIGGKTYLTDENGRFQADSLELGAEGLQLTATLAGPHARIEDSSGQTLSVKVSVKPGDGDFKVVFNPNSDLADENGLAQVSAFHNVNADYMFLKARKLTTKQMDENGIVVRTNIDDECNAYYTPGSPSLNFFKSSENCVNSSYATVSRHEYGHYWDDMTGGIVNGGLSEGWGDMLSMYSLNDPVIGEHFLKQPRPGPDGKLVDYIRHGDNTYQYTGEGDEVHDIGQAWGGFGWKLRKALMAKLGDAAGAALAEALVLPTMFAKAANVPAAMAQVLLADMDSNGNMPHEAEIRAAAAAHGVTLPKNPGRVMSLAKRMNSWLQSWLS